MRKSETLELIYSMIETCPDLTDEGICLELQSRGYLIRPSAPGTWRARRVELEASGRIRCSGEAQNLSGQVAKTWRVTGAQKSLDTYDPDNECPWRH